MTITFPSHNPAASNHLVPVAQTPLQKHAAICRRNSDHRRHVPAQNHAVAVDIVVFVIICKFARGSPTNPPKTSVRARPASEKIASQLLCANKTAFTAAAAAVNTKALRVLEHSGKKRHTTQPTTMTRPRDEEEQT